MVAEELGSYNKTLKNKGFSLETDVQQMEGKGMETYGLGP